MIVTNIDEYVKYWKNKNPILYNNKSKQELFDLVKQRNPHLELPTYEEALLTHLDTPKPTKERKLDTLNDYDTDPSFVDSWFLTGDFIPERFKEKGFMGSTPEFWRDAYNKSMAGMLYKSVHGVDKYGKYGEDGTMYDMDKYDPTWIAQAAQFGVGILSPLDAGVMIATGSLGKAAQVVGRGTIFGGTRFIQRGLLSNFASKYPKMGVGIKETIEGALSLGVGGGAFSASHAAAYSTMEQRMSKVDEDGRGIGDVNLKKTLLAASDEFLHSLPVFAIAGGVTQGIMGPIYGYSKAYGAQTTLGKRMTQAMTSPLARIPVEAGLFTAIPSMTGDEHAPKFNTPEVWKHFGTNLFIVGGMRGIGAAFEPRKFADGKFEAYKFLTNEMKLEQNIKKSTKDATDNVQHDLGRETPMFLREKSLDLIREDLNIDANLKIGKKDLDFILYFNQKLNSKSFAKKAATLGTKENADFAKYSPLVNTYSAGLKGAIETVLKDPARLKENYKSMFGKYPNKTQLKKYELFLKNISNDVTDKRSIVDKEFRGNIEDPNDGINESTNHHKDDFYDIVDSKKAKDNRIVDLVNELSKESGRTQADLKADKTFQKQVQGEWFLSESKLEKALEPYRAEKGGIGDLKTKRKEVKEDSEGHYKKTDYGNIGGRENVQDYAVRKLGKDNDFYHDALYGFNKYVSKRVAKSSPGHYKTLIDYFKYLKENNLDIREATSIITERYAKQNNLTKPQKKTLNDALSSFYGTGDAGGRKGIQTGFAYDFMVKRGRVPSVAVLGKGWGTPGEAGKGIVAVAEPGEYKKFSNIKKKKLKVSSKEQQIGIINIKDGIVSFGKRKPDGSLRKGARQHRVESLDAAIDMLYEFGARGIDVLERLKIKDFDWKNGYIRVFSTGEGAKGLAGPRLDIPLREVIPELWKKLEKVKGNRDPNSKELLFTNDKGDLLTKDFINKFIKETIPKDLVFYGDKKSFTVQDFRRMITSDASGTKWLDFIDLKLVAHKGKETRTTYIHKEFVKEWREWREYREGKAQGITEIKADQSGTKAEQIKFWENTVASIKRDLKTAKSPGQIESLKSELKGAGFRLSAIKKLKERRITERPIGETVFETKGDRIARDKFIKEVIRDNDLTPEMLKREGLKEGVLGEFAEGVIKLQEGLWQPADFYHENLHRLKAFARASNNKGLIKLIEKGESLAKNTKEFREWKKKNIGRDVEEFLADVAGGKASEIRFTKGMAGKVKNFIKQLVSRIKVAFGAGNFKDISNVLAKRVQKGFSTKGVEFAKGEIKYRLENMDSAQASKYAKGVLRDIYKEGELTITQKERMVRHIGEIAGLGEKFKLSKDTPVESIETFIATLNTMDKGTLRRLPDKVEWWGNFKDSEKMRIQKNVTEAERTKLLKDLNVPDGTYYKATSQQLKDFIEILGTMDDVKGSTISWIDEKVARGNLNKSVAERFSKISKAKWGLPVSTVLESIGYKKLANRLFNHTVKELDHIGTFSVFETQMKKSVGRRKWEKVKDSMYLFDKQRYKERLDAGLLSKTDKQFIKEQIDISTWKPKGNVAKEYVKLMKYYKDELMTILKEVLNDAEFEKFTKGKNINWLNPEKNIYVTRRLTREFKKYYNTTENHFTNLIAEQTDKISFRLAKDFFKNKKVSSEKLAKKAAELKDMANDIAHAEIYDLFQFNVSKYSPSFLKKRHVKLPEFVTLDGKKVQVYETKFGLTVKDYAINQAKFLANIEYFPEFVKLKGFNKPGAKRLLNEVALQDKNLGDWIKRRVEGHLGIDKSLTDYPEGIRVVRYTTSLMAKFQLSFPTSGLKNLLMGQTQNLLAYRFRDFLGSWADAIHRDNRLMVRATGANEIGMRHFEMRGVKGLVDKVADKGFFRFGLMRFTENINRYTSVLASKRDQIHLVKKIQSSPKGTRAYRNSINKLKTFYKLSSSEIALLKKYGLNGAKGKERRAVDNMYQKLNTFAHIHTQGAAINLFMPDWGSGQIAQSALLYKRMAYAATVNTMRNFKIAFKNKSPLQILAFGAGTLLSGEVLLSVYDKILGQPMPKENSDEARFLATLLWKGEFLGILSEIFSPYKDQPYYNALYPATLSTAETIVGSLYGVLKGEKFATQGINDALRGTSGLYNNMYKIRKQGFSSPDSYPSQVKQFKGFYYDWINEINDSELLITHNEFNMELKRDKTLRAFMELFESGRKEDLLGNSVGKWYVMTLLRKANDIYYKERLQGNPITDKETMKKARESMEEVLKNLHPNKMKIYPTSTKRRRLKALTWLSWLDKDKQLSPTLKKLDNQFEVRKQEMYLSIWEYINENNLEADMKYYGITFKKPSRFKSK